MLLTCWRGVGEEREKEKVRVKCLGWVVNFPTVQL